MAKELKAKNNTEKATSPFIKGLRVTEKATTLAEKNVYTFNVATDANKIQISKAIETLYKVKPVKIAISKVAEKRVIVKGRRGVKKGGKKAFVYLKKGDRIDL